VAAASLAREAEGARSPELRAALGEIAADEARHAQLAWDVLAWTLSVGNADLRATLARAGAPLHDPAGADDLAALGCLPPQARHQVALEVREKACKRLETLTRA
jgi:hypothetical protein